MARIFFVEDNETLRDAAVSYLKLNDHRILEFDRTAGVLEALRMSPPDLIILDVMLPDGDGFHLARSIRRESPVPILFLTARTAELDRITGFEVGADDYVTKPFSPKELALRVQAILKRAAGGGAAEEKAGEWTLEERVLRLDRAAHRVTVDGTEVALTAAEWRFLEYLSGRAGTVVSRERLLGECLEYLAEGSERTVDTHVKNLRAKLLDPRWIETVRGFGYRFAGAPQTRH